MDEFSHECSQLFCLRRSIEFLKNQLSNKQMGMTEKVFTLLALDVLKKREQRHTSYFKKKYCEEKND